MTEQDLKNFEIIDKLVTNHFSLSKEGLALFKKVLHNKEEKMKYIDEQFHQYLGEDLRGNFELPFTLRSGMDDGWTMFRDIFSEFVDHHEVSYSDYSKNRIVINKQEAKLFKYIKKWYLENEKYIEYFRNSVWRRLDGFSYSDRENFDVCFKKASEKIGTMKLPDKDLKAVLSFNFADWFMVSTSESWSSCLNLQSDYEACYWSGLPGLITDPNRMLIYVTDGKTKNYQGIIVNKFVTRTWGLLEKSGKVFPVRHYPLQLISDEAMPAIFPFPVYEGALDKDNDGFGKGKHYFKDIITNYENEGIYIYQDGTGFELEEDEEGNQKISIEKSHSGYHKVVRKNGKWRLDEDTLYDYTEGLDGLISRGLELSDSPESGIPCYNCGDNVDEDDVYYGDDDQPYCEHCFNSNFTCCSTCGETISIEDANQGSDGDYYCARHFENRFFYCDNCSEVCAHDDGYSTDDHVYCESCFEELCVTCDECGQNLEKSDNEHNHVIVDGDNKILCETCFDKEFIRCEECDKAVKKEDACNHENDELCHSCFIKRIQPDLPGIEEVKEGVA
jgi:hypothetical protein